MAQGYRNITPILYDTYLSKQNPTTNYGTDGTMTIGLVSGVPLQTYRLLLRVDLNTLAPSATIKTCVLVFYVTNPASAAKAMTWYQCTRNDWTETEASWDFRNAASTWTTPGGDYDVSSGVADTLPTAGGVWTSANLAAIAQDAMDLRGGIMQVIGKVDDEALDWRSAVLASTEHATPSYRPTAGINYSAGASSAILLLNAGR